MLFQITYGSINASQIVFDLHFLLPKTTFLFLQKKGSYMKKLSLSLLATTVANQRKAKNITQNQLAELTGINRSMISRLEKEDFTPSIMQLEKLGEVLEFEPVSMFIEDKPVTVTESSKPLNIAVAGTGYVGLSIAVLLAQHHEVTAVDIIQRRSI